MYLKGSHLNFYSFINQERNLNANEAARHNYADDLDRNGLINSNIICDISQKGELFTPLGPPGSVVVYDCNLVHASAENLSPFDRCVYLMFYNSCENTLKNPTRPNYISSRNSTPLPLNEV
jgi:ectoine hydroxylase